MIGVRPTLIRGGGGGTCMFGVSLQDKDPGSRPAAALPSCAEFTTCLLGFERVAQINGPFSFCGVKDQQI